MTVAEGTPQLDGYQIGARTRAAAKAAGLPVTYWIRTRELGWSWATVRGGVPHLVPPRGDVAECGQLLRRAERTPVITNVAATACARCWHRVLGDTPRRSR